MKKNKKAMIASQIFIYILALVVVAFTVMYGYKFGKELHQKSEKVALIEFKTDITSTIESMSTDYGSVKKHSLRIPPNFDSVCFIDLDETCDGTCTPYALVDDSWISRVNANIFLVGKNSIEPIFAGDLDSGISHLGVEGPNGFLCMSRSNSTIAIAGMGNKAVVSSV